MPDLKGRVALVTGGNKGIGLTTVEQLATHGAKVYMGARSEDKANEAIKKLRSANPSLDDNAITWLPLDLANPASVVAAAEKISSAESRLDILINNAAFTVGKLELSADGIDSSMGVNHIGHFILVDRLLPLLKKTASQTDADVRVVTLSSMMISQAPATTRFDTPESLYNPTGLRDNGIISMMKRYSVSKLANTLFASELQRRMDSEGVPIISISVHPGAVATDGGMGLFPNFMKPLLKIAMSTPLQGATTQLFAATAAEVRKQKEKYGGKYLVPYGKVKEPGALATSEKLAGELWESTNELVGKLLPKS
ncbi:NAD(P)-binding protein [Glonium stellatum]|uniref:NAD(P)-binding protein n=1 Tax=Glonium stellatum TaxID=574774 RepID=A0A8E2F909_9PEZI|nr:NAD(P)-binding protein [Glonium stellatum]